VFNAGTHTEAIAMRWSDFARTVRPKLGEFAEPFADTFDESEFGYAE
jgi:hypothetical protein